MKQITIAQIIEWEPSFSSKVLPENWNGTALDVLNSDLSDIEKLVIVLRSDLLSDKLLRLFAVWCARQVQHLCKDSRSLNAIDVAERYALGQATEQELVDAQLQAYAFRTEAVAAAYAAARTAARDAAWAARAAWEAAGAAAYAAASAAWTAADAAAAYAAAWSADAAGTAEAAHKENYDGDADAAEDEARQWQVARLQKMIEEMPEEVK